jgi:hypothetical protein
METDTESAMNISGQFKNIEEFKATAGGLAAFFLNEEEDIREEILKELIGRAVNLIAWREVPDVLPYYCEGLIHLELLYAAGAIDFDGAAVTVHTEAYGSVKTLYMRAYTELADYYIACRNASEYLQRYVTKRAGAYLPATPEVRDFSNAYYERYREMGRVVATVYNG